MVPLRPAARALASALLVAWGLSAGRAGAHELRGADGRPTGAAVSAADLIQPGAPWLGALPLREDAQALGRVAESAAAFLRAHPDDPAATAGLAGELGVTLDDVLRTLDFVAEVARADAGQPAQRLLDPAFLRANFRLSTLQPDLSGASRRPAGARPGQLRITRYLVRELPGRETPSGEFRVALYADPGPEARARFTRAEVVAGAWAAGGARPLVWVTEAGLYDALMQGSALVRLPDGRAQLYNVHENNGHAYIPSERDPARQRRYWYFQPVDALRGYGAGPDKVQLEPGVVVAGDVTNLGLGKLLLIEGSDGPRLVVLADTGGAFVGNLSQLDFLGGVFADHGALMRATAGIPSHARVAMLLRAPPAP